MKYQQRDRLENVYLFKVGRYPTGTELLAFRRDRLLADRASKKYWRQFVRERANE